MRTSHSRSRERSTSVVAINGDIRVFKLLQLLQDEEEDEDAR